MNSNIFPLAVIRVIVSLFLWLTLTTLLSAQTTPDSDEKAPSPGLSFRLSNQDVLLPITSIEWGLPDRWSFTTRYVHEFDISRKPMARRDNFTIICSPATAGMRFGMGYQAIFNQLSGQSFLTFFEARAVALYSWGTPYSAPTHVTFLGGELRCVFFIVFNVGIGYYVPASSSSSNDDALWGFHIGLGI
jgi:hypothetical protein